MQKKKTKASKRCPLKSGVVSHILLWLGFCIAPWLQADELKRLQISPELHLSNYSINDGLSLSAVTAFSQTDDGFIWIGTEEGLNRFDGYQFKVYKRNSKEKHTLPDNQISSLLTDSKGRLWVGTDKGLAYKTNDDKFISVPVEKPLSSYYVSVMVEDIYSRLWVIVNGQLLLFNPNEQLLVDYNKELNLKKIIRNRNISGLHSIGSSLYFGQEGCLFSLDLINQELKERCIKELKADDFPISSISSNKKDTLWIGTHNGVIRYNLLNENYRHYKYSVDGEGELSSNHVQSVFVDSTDRVWIGTSDGLNVYEQDIDSFTRYKKNLIDKNSLLSNDILAFYEDTQGLIWIATYDSGFHIWNKSNEMFNHYFTRKDASELKATNMIHSVTTDLLGNIWIGSYGSGLFKIDSTRSTLVKIQSSTDSQILSNALITDLHFDIYDNLWITTLNGVYTLNPDDNEIIRLHNPLLDETALSITEDRNGELWIGLQSGLVKIQGVKGKLTSNQKYHVVDYTKRLNSILNTQDFLINALYEDVEGLIWVGTDSGLAAFKPEDDTEYLFTAELDNAKSISNNYIQVIYEDTQGVLWIGTGDGLNKLNLNRGNIAESSFQQFTESDGIVNDSIYGIQSGSDDSLWLSTSFGIILFNSANNTTKHFTVKDGLQSNEFNVWASHKSSDGEILFGGVNGVTSFFPDDLVSKQLNPSVKLIEVMKNNKSVDVNSESFPTVYLKDEEDFLTIKTSALNYHNASSQAYRYRLSGLNSDWVELNDTRIINLFGLHAGDYLLEMQVKQRNSNWGDTFNLLAIEVKDNFWQSKTAISIYIFTLVFLIGGMIYWWLLRLNKRSELIKLELEDNREYIKQLRFELESSKDKGEEFLRSLNEVEEKVKYYENKVIEYSKKDKLSQFFKKSFFEEVIANEDDFFKKNNTKPPGGCFIAFSISNYEKLLKTEYKANIESSISELCELISDYVSGDDLIARWDDSTFIMLDSLSFEETKQRVYNFFRLLNQRSFDCGNGRLLKFDFNIALVPTPVVESKSYLVNRLTSAYLAIDFLYYSKQRNVTGAYAITSSIDHHPTEFEKKVSQGIDVLLDEKFITVTNLKEFFTKEKS